MKNILFPILALCLLQACKRDVDDLPLERPFSRDFYAQGEWRDTLPSTVFTAFDYTVGRQIEEPYSNNYTCRSQVDTAGSFKTIQGNLLGLSSTNPLFYVRFSAPGTVPVWSESELKALLVPGRVFPITGSPGEVEIGFEIPWVVNSYLVSKSSNAPIPSGEVKILTAEAYDWMADDIFGNLKAYHGLKVKMQFHANLGRLVTRFAQETVAGTAVLNNGEASLFFEY